MPMHLYRKDTLDLWIESINLYSHFVRFGSRIMRFAKESTDVFLHKRMVLKLKCVIVFSL